MTTITFHATIVGVNDSFVPSVALRFVDSDGRTWVWGMPVPDVSKLPMGTKMVVTVTKEEESE